MILRRCSAIRRRLSAFHDGELAVAERVAIQRHLRECADCAGEARAVREMGEALRIAAAERVEAADVDLAGLSANVITRLGAERSESFSGRLEQLFDDFHVVWAALGATGAAVACVAVLVGLFFSIRERPDSMAALFAAMASPGSNENPVSVDGRMALPSVSADNALWASVGSADTEEDLVLLMDVLVSREGQVRNLKLVNPEGGLGSAAETKARREAIRALSEAILKARLQPARAMSGAPVAVNVVWLHAFLTVRAKLLPELRTPGRALSMLMPAEEHVLTAA